MSDKAPDEISIELRSLLMDLECELRQLSLWRTEPPSQEALASTQPFAVDTMNFTEWLQFIFLPKMHALLDCDSPLPLGSGIKPMAEEYFRELALPVASLLDVLARIDTALSKP